MFVRAPVFVKCDLGSRDLTPDASYFFLLFLRKRKTSITKKYKRNKGKITNDVEKNNE